MLGFGYTFYDKYGNFNNEKLIKLLEKVRTAKYKKLKGGAGALNAQITLFNSVSKKELWQLINKLSIFINSGLDIKGALNILVKQIKNPYLKKIVHEIKENINHGINISETMQQYPKVFDSLTIALISVGEKTGQLGNVLNELDTSLIENIELKGKVKGAMIYPMILFILTLMMVTFMMVFIVPRIANTFASAGSELPGLTQMVINVSNYLINDWYKVVAMIIGIIVTFKIINKTYVGRMSLANLYIKLPLFGFIIKLSNVVYFIKSFTTLLDSGVLLLESLKTSSKVVPNLAYKKELIRIKNEVEVGLTISKSLGLNTNYEESVYLNKLFAEEFAYIVSTGEETGSLSSSLKKIGTNYNNELKRYIGNLSSMMEPIIIVIIGALVGTIVVAIMLPFFALGEVVGGM